MVTCLFVAGTLVRFFLPADIPNLSVSVVLDTEAEDNQLTAEMFSSKKITNKLLQQIQDPLVLSAGALPVWCEELNHSCPFLFPFETRQLYFNCTAFGASRYVKTCRWF